MHMADALLAPAVAATMYTASAVTVGASVKTLRKDEATAKLPTIQCLFFADGGLLALGANCWNMAFYMRSFDHWSAAWLCTFFLCKT